MTEMSANREFVSPKTKIDRPLNAYMLFSLENREQVAKENPELKNKEISKILCQKWRELLKPIKDSFKKRALQIKEKHKEENPDYYPRISSLKKKEKQRLRQLRKGLNEVSVDLELNATQNNSKSISESKSSTPKAKSKKLKPILRPQTLQSTPLPTINSRFTQTENTSTLTNSPDNAFPPVFVFGQGMNFQFRFGMNGSDSNMNSTPSSSSNIRILSSLPTLLPSNTSSTFGMNTTSNEPSFFSSITSIQNNSLFSNGMQSKSSFGFQMNNTTNTKSFPSFSSNPPNNGFLASIRRNTLNSSSNTKSNVLFTIGRSHTPAPEPFTRPNATTFGASSNQSFLVCSFGTSRPMTAPTFTLSNINSGIKQIPNSIENQRKAIGITLAQNQNHNSKSIETITKTDRRKTNAISSFIFSSPTLKKI